ncbi:adenosine deaminase [Microbacterium sp. NPDC058062]|uniref:adenosine deaminase n=1 Tax=Microbacterium sp. NPDC058062 TaxID=3346320 RepID=UPI0036DD299E
MTSPNPASTTEPLSFCELHVHIEGTLEPGMVFDLARGNGLVPPADSTEALAARYEFDDLSSFLKIYYENMTVLRSEEDFALLAGAYLRRARRAGVAHVEMFVDPQAHAARGVSEKTVLRGLHRAIEGARETLGISAGIIACVVRDQPIDTAERMLDTVLATDVPVLGLGLDSAEVGFPPKLFQRVFLRAADAGLRRVAHAGEEGPASYVWEAIDDLGVERIDHGIRAWEDPRLIDRLVADRIPLTVCPLSNVRLKAVKSLQQLPLRAMLHRGLVVTVNSDDPAYFGGYLDDNIAAVRTAFDLDADEIRTLMRNSIAASFLTDDEKLRLLTQPA